MRAVVVGAGAVGARAARQLCATEGLEELVVVDVDQARARAVARSLGTPATAAHDSGNALTAADVVVIATPGGHRRLAEAALERGVHVVSVADGLEEVRALLDLDAEARERDLTVVVGAGFSPGLTCVLARHAAAAFGEVEEVHVASSGAGGPACAAARARSLRTGGVEWRDGAWVRVRPGSGRQLCWFPDPVGVQESFRAGVATSLVLASAFPEVSRITARVATDLRSRVTARLGLPRRARREGAVGAVRVEVRGRRNGVTDVRVLGALDRPALAAGAVAAVAAASVADGRFSRTGAAGLAELVDEPLPFLHELARRGVRAAVYEGTSGG